jgi:putative ABC transport system substrate-binding protein
VSIDAGIGIWGKRLELLREATQKLNTVRLVYTAPALPLLEALKAPLQQAGARFGISVSVAAVAAENDRASYERAFDLIVAHGADGLMVGDTGDFVRFRELIVELVARYRLPAIYCYPIFVEDGGLMSYGIDIEDVFRRAADMTVDLLRGRKAGRHSVLPANQIRIGAQSHNRKVARARISAELAGERRRGDRVIAHGPRPSNTQGAPMFVGRHCSRIP